MTWLNDLCQVYDQNIERQSDTQAYQLMPVGYMTTTTHIEITLDYQGNYQDSKVLPAKTLTMIPCTIKSAGRSSGVTPQPLADNLGYLAGDLEKYGGKYRVDGKTKQTAFESYLAQLKGWAESLEAVVEIKAVYKYIAKKSLIQDLAKSNILYITSNGVLPDKWPGDIKDPQKNEIFNVVTGSQVKAFVRFNVVDGSDTLPLWKRPEVILSWQKYYQRYLLENNQLNLDYITGKMMVATPNHARDLRHSGDSARLISSNDTSGYTYRGRFEKAEQAVSIGYEASNKAFNALKWLIRQQGYKLNNRIFLTWGDVDPSILQVTDRFGNFKEIKDRTDVNYARNRFRNFLKGKVSNLQSNRSVHLMILDSSTPGRMDILSYQTLEMQIYINQIAAWFEKMTIQVLRQGQIEFKTLSLVELAYATYGAKASHEVIKNTVMRLILCVTGNKSIPIDIENRLYKVAQQPLRNNTTPIENNDWYQAVQALVAVLQKKDKKEGFALGLNENYDDRSYLYGRLLAVANKIEADILSQNDIKRPTAAKRYMNAFAQHPDSTWLVIYKLLQPYLAKNKRSNYYGKLIGEIYQKIDATTLYNKPLNARFIAGFYVQNTDLYTKKDNLAVNKEEK